MAVESTQQLAERDVLALSREREEPSWLQELRISGWRAFEQAPVPRLERTRLTAKMFQGFELPAYQGKVSAWGDLPEGLRRGFGLSSVPDNGLVVASGYARWEQLQSEWSKRGVIFTSLAAAASRHPELVQRYLMSKAVTADADKPWALNAALWTDGVFLYVPEGVQIDVPLQSLIWGEGRQLGLFDRTLVVTEANSRVTLVETVSGEAADAPRLRIAAVEIYAGPGSEVKYCALQTLPEGTTNLVFRRAVVGRDAAVHWVVGEFGSTLTASLCDSDLAGRGGESTNLTVFFADGYQHLDVEPRMFHTGTFTQSDILVKGVAKDQARAVYAPLTHVEDMAEEASAFQRGTTLLLSPGAQAYCIPRLQVVEEQVAGAGHAATVGQVDKEQLFYLRSRGLTESQAKKLLVFGFFHPMLDRVPVADVRQRLEALIDGKMPG